ncbi:MAG: electron transfer flavoprotein subunit alpha/FixB family protein [Elusimicrobia bacterium]|nr:electron transfer flavoprotein subunit alpha/FixB family protein [Elusimicrobiota bacterium]
MSETNLGQYKGVWCVGEIRRGKLVPTVYELLSIGGKLAGDLGEPLSVVLVGHQLDGYAKELFEAGAAKVYLADHPELANFIDEAYVKVLADLIEKEKPNKLLLPASTIGRSIAGRLAVRLKTGAMADVTDLSVSSGNNGVANGVLKAMRPAYGGNLIATVLCERSRPEIVTVRPMVFSRAARSAGKTGETVKVAVDPSSWNSKTKFVNFVPEQNTEIDIGSADKIVSGGRGLSKAEGFETIRALAKVLGAAVGASRAAVDSGWIPYRHQVGLTGRTVRPKLYIACGISGQVQHLAGMGQAEVIIAVNKDPDCPLMKLATFSIEADLYEFIPLAVKEIEKHKH